MLVTLPDDPWVGPATDSAMQPHTLLLPHCVGARFNHKLRGVHQAVFVHALEVFLVFMDLKVAEKISQDHRTFANHKLIAKTKNKTPCDFTRNPQCMLEAKTKLLHTQIEQDPDISLFIYTCKVYALNVTHVMSVTVCVVHYVL